MKMKLSELMQVLSEHNKTGKGYQVQLNSANLDSMSKRHTDVEIGDLYFTGCHILQAQFLLCFGNEERKPIGQKQDGTNLYPLEVNSQIFIDISKIESIENLKNFEDLFYLPSEKVINIQMIPENDHESGNRNIISIGFIA